MTYQILGLVLFITGCSHLVTGTLPIETRIIKSLQNQFQVKPYLTFFREIWFFGRTSFALIMLILLTMLKWKMGLSAVTVFLIIVGIEQFIKNIFKRARPFTANQDILMLQLISPLDSSFPSGDALRIWYLAVIIPVAVGGTGIFFTAIYILAALVTVGRSILGVHYPTDALAGTGLGLLAAGTTLWLWQYLGLL